MKYLLFIAVLLGFSLGAGDFSWQLLGTPSKKYSRNISTALFDNSVRYDKDCILWDSSAAPNGCGLIIDFKKPVHVSKIEIVSCKPNNNPYIPEKTEIYALDDDKFLWQKPTVIPDVTGRAKDPKFIKPAVTTVFAPANGIKSSALKILMYGRGIWLAEVRIYDINGKLLVPDTPAAASAPDSKFAIAETGGGASVNLRYFNTRQNYIGNPNGGNRRDRVVIRFDITSLLVKNQVKKARLALKLEPMGDMNESLLEVSVFTADRTSLAAMDLISGEVKPVTTIMFDRKSPHDHQIDVTGLVNEALACGNGSLTFRFRNLTIERNGNRRNRAEGVYLRYMPTSLEIWK